MLDVDPSQFNPPETALPRPNEFGSVTENAVLRDRILREIAERGPIPFRRFMQLALYDPDEGYYHTRPAIGARGDYLTSPEVHPLFGALLCRQIREFWEMLGCPDPFRLIEMGAGNGTLARSILGAAVPELREVIRYVIVEPGSFQQRVQAATLGALARGVDWVPSLDALSAAVGCLVSNELVDSFPVHRVTLKDGRLLEHYVGGEGGRFIDVVGEPSSTMLADYFVRLDLIPGEGCDAEVNLDALTWIRDVAQVLLRGFVLTIDYGYPAHQLYASWRKQGTLLTFRHHTCGSDPLQRVGRQDITAHVDFTSLARSGRDAGLEPLGFTSQQRFLASLGIHDALAGGPAAAPSLEEYLARRRAVETLLDPEGLGRLRVLVQGKGIDTPSLSGFDGAKESLR